VKVVTILKSIHDLLPNFKIPCEEIYDNIMVHGNETLESIQDGTVDVSETIDNFVILMSFILSTYTHPLSYIDTLFG